MAAVVVDTPDQAKAKADLAAADLRAKAEADAAKISPIRTEAEIKAAQDKAAADAEAARKKAAWTITIKGYGGLGCGKGATVIRESYVDGVLKNFSRQVPCGLADCRDCSAARLLASVSNGATITSATISGPEGEIDVLHRVSTEEKEVKPVVPAVKPTPAVSDAKAQADLDAKAAADRKVAQDNAKRAAAK